MRSRRVDEHDAKGRNGMIYKKIMRVISHTCEYNTDISKPESRPLENSEI